MLEHFVDLICRDVISEHQKKWEFDCGKRSGRWADMSGERQRVELFLEFHSMYVRAGDRMRQLEM